MNLLPVPINLLLLYDTEEPNDNHGKLFEDFAAALLAKQGWEVRQRLRVTGQEIDILAEDRRLNKTALVQCKFQQSAIAAKELYQLLGQALAGKNHEARFYSLSEPTKDASGLLRDWADTSPSPNLHFGFFGPQDICAQFAAQVSGLVSALPAEYSSLLYLVWGDLQFAVAAELRSSTSVNEYSVWGVPANEQDTVLGLLRKHPAYADSRFSFDLTSTAARSDVGTTTRPVVLPLVMSDAARDLRPAGPRHFVGRDEFVSDVLSHLQAIATGQKRQRCFSIVGQSGLGKSSVILKIASETGRTMSEKMFARAIDVRTASSSLFLNAAIESVLRTAQEKSFFEPTLPLPNGKELLQTSEFAGVAKSLRSNDRQILILFDQFEEILMKESLQYLFSEFERTVAIIDAQELPLVLGFSWRNDISAPVGNRAASAWSNTGEFRRDFHIDRMSFQDSMKVVQSVNGEFTVRLSKAEQRRISAVALGQPWFLKKLTTHFLEHRKAKATVDALDGIGVEALFKADLALLQPGEEATLRSIAKQSPVEWGEVTQRHSDATVESLVKKRLVVRIGPKLAIYWDHFRDYLNENRLPSLPLTFIPNSTFETAEKIIHAASARTKTAGLLARACTLRSEETVRNALSGLRQMGVNITLGGERNAQDATDDFLTVKDALRRHIVFPGDGKTLTREEFSERYARIYMETHGVSTNRVTIEKYVERLVGWYEGTELVSVDGESLRFR